jgi:uncharacterized RDD family membrane protein YckC
MVLGDEIIILRRLNEMGWKSAPRWRRCLATLIDLLLAEALAFLIVLRVDILDQVFPTRGQQWTDPEYWMCFVVFLAIQFVPWFIVFIFYNTFLWSLFGTSIAKILFGLHVVDETGDKPNFLTCFFRALIHFRACFKYALIGRGDLDGYEWVKVRNALLRETGTEVMMH